MARGVLGGLICLVLALIGALAESMSSLTKREIRRQKWCDGFLRLSIMFALIVRSVHFLTLIRSFLLNSIFVTVQST